MSRFLKQTSLIIMVKCDDDDDDDDDELRVQSIVAVIITAITYVCQYRCAIYCQTFSHYQQAPCMNT